MSASVAALLLFSPAAQFTHASSARHLVTAPQSTPTASPTVQRHPYRLPLAGASIADITRHFTPAMRRFGPGHRGIDLGTAWGAEVIAPHDGRVTFSGQVAGRTVLVLRHDDDLLSTLEAIDSDLAVGDLVVRGQLVGHVAAGHRCETTTSCLHWGVRTGPDRYINPLLLLGPMRARLLADVEIDDLRP